MEELSASVQVVGSNSQYVCDNIYYINERLASIETDTDALTKNQFESWHRHLKWQNWFGNLELRSLVQVYNMNSPEEFEGRPDRTTRGEEFEEHGCHHFVGLALGLRARPMASP